MLEYDITIMKYKLGDEYHFEVMDKNDEEDEVERLDNMIRLSLEIEAEARKNSQEFKQLWIKNTVIV